MDYAPALFEADEAPIPPFDPQISLPADYSPRVPARPEVERIVTDERAIFRHKDGTLVSQIVLVMRTPPQNRPAPAYWQVEYRLADRFEPWSAIEPVPVGRGQAAIPYVVDGLVYATFVSGP